MSEPQGQAKEETINIAPSWRGTADICIMLLEAGNGQAKEVAKRELRRMGRILDQKIDEQKV